MAETMGSREVAMVQHYLRGQNLEQLGRRDDAVAAYEVAVTGRFDSAGPYDRLIFLYSADARHAEVVRVAQAALSNVRTYEGKKAWYRRMESEARARLESGAPKPIPRPS